jgi:phosphoenolpyruvate carboxykinase (GTP)
MATAPSSFKPLSEISPEVADWVAEVANLTTPDRIHWFDGSAAETARLRNELLARKELAPLNE